jgi:hypothetical protein
MFRLKKGTQAYWIARMMTGQWVSALYVSHGLHIIDMHARLPDIRRAGGEFNRRDVDVGGVSHTEYTLTKAPSVEGWGEGERDAFNRQVLPNRVPAPNAPAWIPPEPFAKLQMVAQDAMKRAA